YDIETGIEIAEQLDGHLDLIHVSAGDHEVWEVFTVTHPSMFLEDGVNVKYAAEIKKHVKKSSIATVGALADPELMEEIIASGKADVVEVARGLFADPDLPLKARTGRQDEIRKCMRCLACFSGLIRTGQFSCAINPVIGHELENKTPVTPKEKKNILVAGGGIGGMEAAITAAELGHNVILCEKSDSLGGALKCEHEVSFKKHLDGYINLQRRTIAKSAIDVRLNTEVTPELAKELEPDVIIAALGARPVVPTFLKGYDLPNVVGAEEVYYDTSKAGKNVVILGGGLVGAELAIHLSELGRKVTIIEMMPELNNGGNILHGVALGIKLRDNGIDVNLSTKALEITEKGVIAENADGQKLYEGDTVIYAIGQRPLRAEADALRFCAPEFYQIGDCLTPKNITEATKSAYYIVRDIGRI
ncbi:MAG: FAD-dependent oxidoreductase, partial [Oscillospiraceae bacterium]|nr:FAD-dependent oxidoreductase [Oscillospiraceae bacterium]